MDRQDTKRPLVVVAGPTASGKTALAVELALRFGGEVVSADSMQVYRGMDIATAKPDEAEMRGVPHHLIDFIEPDDAAFSVADYTRLAHAGEAADTRGGDRALYRRGRRQPRLRGHPRLAGGAGGAESTGAGARRRGDARRAARGGPRARGKAAPQ